MCDENGLYGSDVKRLLEGGGFYLWQYGIYVVWAEQGKVIAEAVEFEDRIEFASVDEFVFEEFGRRYDRDCNCIEGPSITFLNPEALISHLKTGEPFSV
jgi:hypothetical protein